MSFLYVSTDSSSSRTCVCFGEGLGVRCCTVLLIWGLAEYQKVLPLPESIAIIRRVSQTQTGPRGDSYTVPSQDEGTRREQRPQEWWLSSEEKQGQPLLTGADSQYWKSADWVIFQTRLERARPELLRHGLPLQPRHQKRLCKDPTAEAATEDASRTFSF